MLRPDAYGAGGVEQTGYTRIALAIVLLSCLFIGGCATGKWSRYELYTGQTYSEGKRRVSAGQWQDFLDDEVTPRFKEGYTVYDALGCWGGGGYTYSERSKVLMIVSQDGRAEELVDQIAAAYKKMFKQDSVLKIVNNVDVEFK